MRQPNSNRPHGVRTSGTKRIVARAGAYFTDADEPYDKLKRALRTEVDEAAWSSLYSTTSCPFDPPKTGKIAIKVINHYGDEVLKVYGV